MSRDSRKWLALAALSLAVLLVAVDNTVLALAIPSLSEDLDPSATQLLWIGDIYSFVLAGLLITMGNVGDRIGRKRLLMIGLVAFATVSVMAAFARTAGELIALRALLGVAGATLMPSTLSLIRSTFPDSRERTFAVSVWGAVAAFGSGFGPLLGGVLLEHFWWGSVFLINVPIVLVIIALGAPTLQESKDPAPGSIDVASIGLSLSGILLVIAGIKELAAVGAFDRNGWVFLLAGGGLSYWFVRRQLRLASPLLDMRLFANPAFSGAVASDLISVFSLVGVYFFLAQQFQFVEGDSPLQAGFWLLPGELGALVGSLLVTKIVFRSGRRMAIGAGIGMGAVGMLILGLNQLSGTVLLVTAIVLVGLGFGMSLTGTSDAILAAAPPERAGAASAVSETAYELGSALGIAILGTIAGLYYRHDVVIPAGLPAEAQKATADSLAAATQSAQDLPPALAEAMLSAAQVAYANAFSVACLVAAVIAAAGAVVAFRVLPGKAQEDAATAAG